MTKLDKLKIDTGGSAYEFIGQQVNLVAGEYDAQSGILSLQTDNAILDKIYPIGSVYISIGDIKPAFGQWERLATGTTLWNDNNADGRTIEAGLPNITGSINNTYGDGKSGSGAFYAASGNTKSNRDSWSSVSNGIYKMDASRSSPVYGKSTTVQPPAIAVSMWKRIS